jgi:SAM-dependent methyltransferase
MISQVTTADACPICAGSQHRVLEHIRYEETWSRFERDFGVSIPGPIRDANAPLDEVSLVRCAGCGLDRFLPMLPGDADFYDALMTAVPYTRDRWDFRFVRTRVSETDDVLDLGCGEGNFLGSLGERAGRAAGVDHNEAAIARFIERGGEGYVASVEDLAATHAGSFDVVTAFHTLEHVPEPVTMLRAAGACLRRGGTMYVSVPNRDRTWQDPAEPMDRPPHHLTRWGPEQLEAAADRAGLLLEAIELEPPNLSVARALLERALLQRLPESTRRPCIYPARALSMVAMPRYRYDRMVSRGVFLARGIRGHTLLGVLRG